MKDLQEVIKQLRQPFHPAKVNFKIQSVSRRKPESRLIVAYVDARDVSERLNAVCPEHWATKFEHLKIDTPLEQQIFGVECTLTLRSSEWSVSRSDVGEAVPSDSDNIIVQNDIKTVYSDAFKRAAVHFGVATSLYDLPQMWRKWDKDNKYIPDEVMEELRKTYKNNVESAEWKKKYGDVFSIKVDEDA